MVYWYVDCTQIVTASNYNFEKIKGTKKYALEEVNIIASQPNTESKPKPAKTKK